MESNKNIINNEFSRLFDLYRVGKLPIRQTIKATEPECVQLALRLGVQDIHKIEAQFTIEYFSRAEGYNVDGEIQATISQVCVLTTELITQSIVIPVKVNYRSGLTEEQLTDLDLSSDRDIFGFDDPHIDLGEMVVQYLSLNIDPYPKKNVESNVFKLF